MQTYLTRLGEELGLLFLARPAGQSVLIPAGRPARRLYELRPAGRTQFRFWPAGRPAARIPLHWRSFFWLAGCLAVTSIG